MSDEEYLRRSLVQCGGIGARSEAELALRRLRGMRRPPKWLIKSFEVIGSRVTRAVPELTAWRDAAPDAPKRKQGK